MTFAYALTSQAASLVAGSYTVPVGAGPADSTRVYLGDGRLDRVYTFTSSNAVTLQIDLGSAKAVNAWAVLNHNFNSLGGGTCKIDAADDVAWTTNIVAIKAASTFATTAPKHKDAVFQFASATKRVWRLTFTNVTTGSVTIGEVFAVAATTQLTRGMVDGSGEDESIISSAVEMQYGSKQQLFFSGPIRQKTFRSQDYTESQKNELATLFRSTLGPVTPFLWIESYEATSSAAAAAEQDCILGRLELPNFRWSWTDYNLTQPPELIIRALTRGRGA